MALTHKKSFLFFTLFFSAFFVAPTASATVLCTYAPENAGELPGCREFATRDECRTFCTNLGRPCASDESQPTCNQWLAGQSANQQRNAAQPPAAAVTPAQTICTDIKDTKDCSSQSPRCVWDQKNQKCADANKKPEKTDKNAISVPSASVLNELGTNSPQQFIGRLIKAAMGVMGTIALAVLVYAGVLWMTAAGNSDRERKALDIMFWGALGVLVILSSYTIVQFIVENALVP